MVSTLKDFMDKQDWDEIALAYHLGVSLNTVKNIKTGKHYISGAVLKKLRVLMKETELSDAEALDVIDSIISGGAQNA